MSTEAKQLPYSKEYIRNFSESRGEPQWLLDLRLRSLTGALELPMPETEKTRIIGWNFTDFNHDTQSSTFESPADFPDAVRSLTDADEQERNVLVHHNSTAAYENLAEKLSDKGVIFTDMETAIQEHSDLVHKYIMNAVDAHEHRLTALNAALINCGTFLYVPKNVEIDVPLHAIYWKDDPQAGIINHTLIVVEDHSSVTYVENYLSENQDHSSVANIISEVFVGQNARLAYGSVDNFAEDVTSYVNRRGHISRDGKIEWALGQMNDGHTISDNTTNLVGSGSYADVKAVAVGVGTQNQNFDTRVRHYGEGSEGYIMTHGVMKDKSKAIFNGISKIEHGAAKATSKQTERVLMLSEGARGDANPILLIDEYDVEEAGHAASVGRVDEVQMYYLMSRGISRTEAQRLIIHGFLTPVVDQLPVEGVKNQMVEVIERKVV